MNNEAINERIAIKNLIFTKALPNHIIPVPIDGYKTYACIDCGDKFLFETSYNDHRNRKSLRILYYCRYCKNLKIFYNRCQFLSHIRSHPFKTATINVNDLKLNPLSDEDFREPIADNIQILDNPINYNYIITAVNEQTSKTLRNSSNGILPTASNDQISECQTDNELNCCYECNEITNKCGVNYKDRADHYMKKTKTTFSCPICLFLLPTLCALEAHLRIHLRIPPYFCPECGVLLPQRCISYPFNHGCEGMKMMKASVKIKCLHHSCKSVMPPNDYKAHFKTHFTTIYICSFCLEKTTKKSEKCKRCNKTNIKNSIYVQCPLCTKKKILRNNIDAHLNYHCNDVSALLLNCQVYPCTICNTVCDTMYILLNHCITIHNVSTLEKLLWRVTGKAESEKHAKRDKTVYHRVLKRCNKCLRSFSYRCSLENINTLPNDCPYKCTLSESNETSTNMQIQCFLCKRKISENWSNIKTHFELFHKSHKCLDLKVMLTRIDKKKLKRKKLPQILNIKKKTNQIVKEISGEIRGKSIEKEDFITKDANICNVCKSACENKKELEMHMITHRDPCMAYQCLECGQCFVGKPSFSTHLLVEHGIPDVQDYIDKKPCYNELAMLKNRNSLNVPVEEPVEENQCRICREKFKNEKELEKHFRVHGMAFLIKNTLKNNSP